MSTTMSTAEDAIRADVLAVVTAIDIVSLSAVRLRDEAPVAVAAQPGASPAESLIQALQGLMYGRCYSHRLDDAVPAAPVATVGADAEHVRRLSAANRSRERWDPGWQIYQLAANGQVFVLKGDRQRASTPGEYIAEQMTGLAPAVGSMVTLRVARESQIMQPGFYYMFGEIPTDIWDEHTLIRFYFSCTADRIADLVHQLTGELNRYQVPYRMKALTDPAHYTRTDSMVLYCARRYFAPVAGIITSLGPAATAALKDSVPLFAKPLRQGVGVAEDPGNGQSFGMHRCRLVAEGLLDAWQQGAREPDKRLECVAARFTANRLRLERAYLGPDAVDHFVMPGLEAVAA
jgi:HopA1 effector protein family